MATKEWVLTPQSSELESLQRKQIRDLPKSHKCLIVYMLNNKSCWSGKIILVSFLTCKLSVAALNNACLTNICSSCGWIQNKIEWPNSSWKDPSPFGSGCICTPLQRSSSPPMSVLDMTQNNLMVRLQEFWSFGECGVPRYCHHSKVHSDLESWQLISYYLWINHTKRVSLC